VRKPDGAVAKGTFVVDEPSSRIVLCRAASKPSEGRHKGGCSLRAPGDPVAIPHDIENRGEATGIDQQLNPQVSSLVPPSAAGHGFNVFALSRWRHGFEPRWDYPPVIPGRKMGL
jgi:hypothetical protein